MGKGDRKTRRGKITSKSYGKLRPRKRKPAIVSTKEEKTEETQD